MTEPDRRPPSPNAGSGSALSGPPPAAGGRGAGVPSEAAGPIAGAAPADAGAPADAYRVLARRYRPQRLADLVGQEAMVRSLRAAFETGRIAQAFILTGIRGTGKTTTARLIAKGLNCVGPDGTGGPTTEPCGVCEPCVAITEGRHVDVLEMDAASRTGVGDVREIIDSVAYRAASARYKVHIIDEVHMLSTSAFNALLKTLEEPPPHVVFVFATTEIRRVPVTVLSRCQRFDLRRIEPEAMMGLLRRIAVSEGARASDEALALIVRAAEGSARDATSLLDQAIAVAGAAEIEAQGVRAMLGLADRARTMDLFEMILRGRVAEALAELRAQAHEGADPMAVLRDLAELTHWTSVIRIAPEAADDPLVSPDARERGRAIAGAASMRSLSRMWQMLLVAIEEVARAPSALMAAEMAVIRLTHVADLPTPEELVRRLQDAAPHETAARSGPGAAEGAAGRGGAGDALATPEGREPRGASEREACRVPAEGAQARTAPPEVGSRGARRRGARAARRRGRARRAAGTRGSGGGARSPSGRATGARGPDGGGGTRAHARRLAGRRAGVVGPPRERPTRPAGAGSRRRASRGARRPGRCARAPARRSPDAGDPGRAGGGLTRLAQASRRAGRGVEGSRRRRWRSLDRLRTRARVPPRRLAVGRSPPGGGARGRAGGGAGLRPGAGRRRVD